MRLEAQQIAKRYGSVAALDRVSLDLGPGVHGLLGPNGAGKSTLMRILATISRPTAGRVSWNGIDIGREPDRLRRVLGYLPQDFGVYPNLTPLEFLRYLAAAKGLDATAARLRIDELLVLVNLTESRNRRLGGFSGGMRQRIGIAQALLNDPHLLIVDEPTAGLDPEERVRFRNLLAELAADRVVLLSTHIVADVEAIAETIALIDHGRLLVHAAPEELLRRVDGGVWSWVVPSSELAEVRRRHRVTAALRRADGVHLKVVAAVTPDPRARPIEATLEDAYLALLGAGRPETAAAAG